MKEMQKHELAFQDYLAGMQRKAIAEKYGVSVNTVKSWMQRYGWKRSKMKMGAHPHKEKGRTQPMEDAPTGEDYPDMVSQMAETVIQSSDLNQNQQLFCLLMANGTNATQAYMRVYRCSYQNALTSGPALFRNPRIKAEVNKLRQIKLEAMLFDEKDLLAYHINNLQAKLSDYVTFGTVQEEVKGKRGPDGKPLLRNKNVLYIKNSDQMDATFLQEVKFDKGGLSVKLQDKKYSAQFLEKYLGLFQDKKDIDIAEAWIAAMIERAEAEKQKVEEESSDD